MKANEKITRIIIHPDDTKTLAFVRKIIEDKKAIHRYLSKHDNYEEIKQRGIEFARPI